MKDVHRLVFVLPDISGGGAARVACILCGEWIKLGHEVHLVTFEEPGAPSFYSLDARVIRHQIGLNLSQRGLMGFASSNARRVWRVRQVIRRVRPTGVIAFLAEANMAAVIGSWGLGVPVLISERNHPAHYRLSPLRALLRRWIYPLATRLCVQTEDIRNWFYVNLGVVCSIIPNPVFSTPVDDAAATAERPLGERRRALSLGRLEVQKGYDTLIEAFASIADRVPDWDIIVWGEGGERPALERQIARLGLERRFFLPGTTATPIQELLASDLYLHAARFEGFPNALIEALSAGLCVVATDCPGATSEILRGGEAGVLVAPDDVTALAQAMRLTMLDGQLRSHYEKGARDSIGIYSPGVIARRWLDELELSTIRRTQSSRPLLRSRQEDR